MLTNKIASDGRIVGYPGHEDVSDLLSDLLIDFERMAFCQSDTIIVSGSGYIVRIKAC